MGSDKLQHHHSVTIMTHILDDQAWDLAKTYIKNPVLVRERVMQILEESKPHEAAEDIKKSIEAINKKISNLIALAEDIDDDEKLADIRVRVTELQKQRKQANTMFHHAEEEGTFQEELEKELGRFEEWAQKVQPLLEQEDFKPTHEEMQKACVILGITVKVYPEKAENRVEFSIAPPSIFKVLCTQLPNVENTNCLFRHVF